MPEAADFDRLLPAIYDAALDARQWDALLPGVLSFLGAERGNFGLKATGAASTSLSLTWNLDPALLGRFQAEFAGRDPWGECIGWVPAGAVAHYAPTGVSAALRGSALYEEVFFPVGVEDGLISVVSTHGDAMSFFGAFRSRRAGDFTPEQVARARRVAPHLARATEIQLRLGVSAALAESLAELVDRTQAGVLLVTEDGRVASANRSAERLLARGDGLSVRGGKLVAAHGGDALARAIAEASRTARGASASGASVLRIARRGGEASYQAIVAPVPERARAAVIGPAVAAPSAMIVVYDTATPPRLDTEAVRTLFDLTPRLAQLAVALVDGEPIKDFAARNGVKESTVREQVKELLARTNAHRQSEVVAALLAGIARFYPTADD